MRYLLEDLPWLPHPPADFKAQCKQLPTSANPWLEALDLALYRLDDRQLMTLSRACSALPSPKSEVGRLLRPFKLAVTGNCTLDMLAPILIASGLRHGLQLEVTTGGFNQTAMEALNPNSPLLANTPDGVLMFLDHNGLELSGSEGDSSEHEPAKEALQYLTKLAHALSQNGVKNILVHTIVPPPLALLGHLESRIPQGQSFQIEQFNQMLRDEAYKQGWVLLDLAHLVMQIGSTRWFDPIKWHLAKLPFDPAFLPLYGDHVCRLLAANLGQTRKCLVLDLDNTLWGGVIGDDGLDGIVLGQGDPMGEAFVAFQKLVLSLKKRGVILAVCSKNQEETALQPFRAHQDMVLKEADIAVFMANWNPKSENLKAIALQLNIGLDSLVFVDDNPAEREQVRTAFPQVAVVELPEDPAYYGWTLLGGGWFESLRFTQEDTLRADQYRAEQQRQQLQLSTLDLTDFLISLAMQGQMGGFNAQDRRRVTQLINKTNQFNCTTLRVTEEEVAAYQIQEDRFGVQMRLQDRFGDHGLISAIAGHMDEQHWYIDLWVMSCRVFNRQVEHAMLNELVAQARRRGVKILVGRYLPTQRNKVIQTLFVDFGFSPMSGDDECWSLDLTRYESRKHCIEMMPYQTISVEDQA
ncbi:HAD-IIIC family phosphatase [Magnetococcus sp. PR-3]|uniref:HAD-IIIC family phosphatase n=1 Tax=Magnetococcus sp. PR-3 TaxID=3120355 RepID=UPI002FCE59EB